MLDQSISFQLITNTIYYLDRTFLAIRPYKKTVLKLPAYDLERFSIECRKVIGFAFTTLRHWFKKLAPLFHPSRSKTKTNRDSLVRVFPHFASATCNYFVFWLVHLIVCVLCDWLAWLLWFWFLRHSIENRSKAGVNIKAVFWLGITFLTQISRSVTFQAIKNLYAHLTYLCFGQVCKFFGDF